MKGNILGRIADKMLESIGFKKIEDSEHCVSYERWNERHNYLQKLDILYKVNSSAIIQSYDPDLFDQKKIGNSCVGLTREEAVAAAMKLRSKGWK